MFTIKSLKLKVIGFWDQCFFRQNSKYSGLICLDESGNEKLYSYFELRQMMKKAGVQCCYSRFTKDELIIELANICVKLMEEIDGINTDLSEEEDE